VEDGYELNEMEVWMKHLYTAFFDNEHKLAVDKIRNKNKIFKQFYEKAEKELLSL
jgi:hypothetical protein